MKLFSFTRLFLSVFLFASCGKEVFAPKTQSHQQAGSSNPLQANSQCAGFTRIEPQVDFLFVVDNSTSTGFLNDQVKQAFSNTLRYIATERFDYRIVIIPLLDTSQQIVISKYNIPGVALTNINSVNLSTFFNYGYGAQEHGFFRVLDFIGKNVDSGSGGLFRKNANTIVVQMSNQDDNDYQVWQGGTGYYHNFNTRLNQFKKFTYKYWQTNTGAMDNGWSRLDANRLRYLTIVADNVYTSALCNNQSRPGRYYQNMSKQMYYFSGDNDQVPSDNHPDSYDLCSGNFVNIFNQINYTIKDIIEAHSYDYWQVADIPSPSTPFDIDVSTLSVTKLLGGTPVLNVLPFNGGNPDGYEYITVHQTNINTRYLPTPGEPRTGYFVRLYGNARATYPECIQINYQRNPDFYGYIVLPQAPLVDASLIITKNGTRLNESISNGWTYIGYVTNQNIRVSGALNDSPLDTPIKPGIFKTGHVLKLNGNAIYSNNDVVNVDYKPAPL